jgi:DNA-binding MarR family transcriptional regulator
METAMARRSGSDHAILPGESRDDRPNVGHLLRAPLQAMVRGVVDGLAAAGFDDLTPAHTAVFQHIEADGTRLVDLAARAQMTKQSMGYLVDQLERRGYVERRADPTDRRAALVVLTDRGWSEVRAALDVIAGIERRWARALGTERMEQLRELLVDLNAAVD